MKSSQQIETEIRRLRQRIGADDCSDSEAARLGSQIEGLKQELFAARDAEASAVMRGPFSGLTKRELAMSGTCETDWI